MGLYPIDDREAYIFSKGIASMIVEEVDEYAFQQSCRRAKRGSFPLRYRRARFVPRPKKSLPQEALWNDPNAPFSYNCVSHHDGNIDDTMGHVDVFGYHGRGAVINNIIIDRIDPFGPAVDDSLSALVQKITLKQEEQFRDRIEQHRDRLRRIRLQYGAHDRRYKEALANEPAAKPTIVDIARHEMELMFLNITFEKQPFGLIGLDLAQRSMSFGVELGVGRKNKSARYFGILELGQNSRWQDDPCMIFSTYAKEDGQRHLHPFLVPGDTLRKTAGNDLVRFLARVVMRTNRSQEFFARFSTEVRRHYVKMFPFSSTPLPRARP